MSKEVEFKNRDRFIQLGLTIAALRKMQGMSQEQLAEKAKTLNIIRQNFTALLNAPEIQIPISGKEANSLIRRGTYLADLFLSI